MATFPLTVQEPRTAGPLSVHRMPDLCAFCRGPNGRYSAVDRLPHPGPIGGIVNSCNSRFKSSTSASESGITMRRCRERGRLADGLDRFFIGDNDEVCGAVVDQIVRPHACPNALKALIRSATLPTTVPKPGSECCA